MKVSKNTRTQPDNDFSEFQEHEGWTGTSEEYTAIMEQRIAKAVMAQLKANGATAQHGTKKRKSKAEQSEIELQKITDKIMKALTGG